MQPVRLYILSEMQFVETYEITQWRKVKQMEPVRLCLLLCKRFEETFKTTVEKKQTNATSVIMHPLMQAI